MNRTTAAVLIALAFTAGNIAAPSAQGLKQLRSAPQQHTLSPQAPSAPQGITTQPFVAKCATGFQKFGEEKSMKAGVPVVLRFGCRTSWVECPDLPAYDSTWLEYEIESQGASNEGKRIRLVYTCRGVDIAG